MTIQAVKIPDRLNHQGKYSIIVKLEWICPTHKTPRGTPYIGESSDGFSFAPLQVSRWVNPCGCVETYTTIREEAAKNGLNGWTCKKCGSNFNQKPNCKTCGVKNGTL